MTKVLIIQGQMKQYRVHFFEKLGDTLRQDGIDLRVAYSNPNPRYSGGRQDNSDLPEGLGLKVKGRWIFGDRILYQPLMREIAASDLIVAEQANRYLSTYMLVALSRLRIKHVAFWGHGENKNADHSRWSEWVRRRIATKVGRWFTYTKGTKKYLLASGVPEDRITVVQNAIDTREFSDLVSSIRDDELLHARRQFGIREKDPIGLFCGALLPDKGIGFLLEAAEKIKAQIPQFHLFIVGGGPEGKAMESAAQKSPWLHVVGPKFGREKALFFRMADVFLLPGRVGLAILDAFAAGLPLITTDIPYHCPEIEYLEHGCNGLISKHDAEDYASQVVSFFKNPSLRMQCAEGAAESGRRFSVDVMVSNFRAGIHAALRDRRGEFVAATASKDQDSRKADPSLRLPRQAGSG